MRQRDLAERRIQHPLNHQLYQYNAGVRFDPGAPAEAFTPLFTLPPIVIRGAGRVPYGSIRPLQPPQIYFTPQVGVQGLGGIQAGQMLGQPLIDPSSDGS